MAPVKNLGFLGKIKWRLRGFGATKGELFSNRARLFRPSALSKLGQIGAWVKPGRLLRKGRSAHIGARISGLLGKNLPKWGVNGPPGEKPFWEKFRATPPEMGAKTRAWGNIVSARRGGPKAGYYRRDVSSYKRRGRVFLPRKRFFPPPAREEGS